VRYSATHFSGSVPVGDKQNNWTYAEVVPTELRVNPTYSKVTAVKYTHDEWRYSHYNSCWFKERKIGVRKG
jgi:hypothetical protein